MSASKLAEQIAEQQTKIRRTAECGWNVFCMHATNADSRMWPVAEAIAELMFKYLPELEAKIHTRDEMALRVFEDTRERAAKIAADAIAPNRRDIAEAIRAMQPELGDTK